MPGQTRLKFGWVAGVLCLLIVSNVMIGKAGAVNLRAVTDDGRKVLLRQDHTWIFIQPSHVDWNTGSTQILLDKAVIQTHTIKVQKNKRVRSQMVFEFNLFKSADSASSRAGAALDTSLVAVADDTGKSYEVKSLQLVSTADNQDEADRLLMKVDKSPGLLSRAEHIEVVFQARLFDSEQAIRFRTPVDDFETVEVDGF
jgi:hypothetical protein